MTTSKTLHEREKELRSLLANAAGQKELQQLEARCFAASGTLRPERSSAITYILVHERGLGLING